MMTRSIDGGEWEREKERAHLFSHRKISPPPLLQPLTGVATTFNGNDQQALDAAAQGVAVADRSHCRRLRVSGRGRLAFLHGQATNDFGGSGVVEFGGSGVGPPAPGDVLPNVAFALPDGRVRDFGTAFVTADGVLLQASPWSGGRDGEQEEEEDAAARRGGGEGGPAARKRDPSDLLAALDGCVFPGDEVSIADVTAETASFALLGPGAASALAALGALDAGALPKGKMMLLGGGGGGGGGGSGGSLNGGGGVGGASRSPVVVARGGGLSEAGDGFTLILDRAAAPDLWRALVAVGGAVPMGDGAWERARVLAGRPAVGTELGAGVPATALEAGLCGAVSIEKGCYVGQEALAKAAGVGRLKQQLWGLRLADSGVDDVEGGAEGALAVGATIWPASPPPPPSGGGGEASSSSRGAPAGRVTSVAADADNNPFALAYVSSTGRAGAEKLSEGLEVVVELKGKRARAALVDLPFASRELPERAAGAVPKEEEEKPSVAPNDKGGREARLAAMKARLEAYQRGEAAPE